MDRRRYFMSKLNLSGFLNDLDKLPFTVRLLDDSGESYLIEKVLKPLLADEIVSIDDLDFNKFDQTCIHTLIERSEEADSSCSTLPLYQQAVHTRPAVRSNCDFV